MSDATICNIHIEMILNSYTGAKKDQVVVLEFIGSEAFRFEQKNDYDYSDIYHIDFDQEKDGRFTFQFQATSNNIPTQVITCKELICKEL